MTTCGSERYLVPLVDGREPADGEGLWTALARGDRARSAHRSVRRRAGRPASRPACVGERRLAVEQSNTSVVLGERLILKLYRLLEPGENPDVEVSAFLAGVGFADTPALAGSVTYEADGSRASAAMLQAYLAGAGDAWAAMLSALASDPERGVEMAERIGDLTARLHRALASRPEDLAFPARPATVEETAAWRASAERQTTLAVDSVARSGARASRRRSRRRSVPGSPTPSDRRPVTPRSAASTATTTSASCWLDRTAAWP